MSHTRPLLPALCSKREGSSQTGQEAQESPGEGQVGRCCEGFQWAKSMSPKKSSEILKSSKC